MLIKKSTKSLFFVCLLNVFLSPSLFAPDATTTTTAATAALVLQNAFVLLSRKVDGQAKFLLKDSYSNLVPSDVDIRKNDAFLLVPNNSGKYSIYYGPVGSKPSGYQLVIRCMVNADPILVLTNKPMVAYDKTSFTFITRQDGTYEICNGSTYLRTDQSGKLTCDSIANKASAQDQFSFFVTSASAVYQGAIDKIFAQAQANQERFAIEMQDAKDKAYQAIMLTLTQDLANATDDQIVDQQKTVARLQTEYTAMCDRLTKAKEDADLARGQADALEAARVAQVAKLADAVATVKSQFPEFDLSVMTVEEALSKYPKYSRDQLEEGKSKLDILKSSKEEMIARMDADAKKIAQNQANIIQLQIAILQLEKSKAQAVIDSNVKIAKARADAENAQGDRRDELLLAYENQRKEVTTQIKILTEQLETVRKENEAMRDTLAKLQAQQLAEQDAKMKLIAELEGVVYAPDLFTAGEIDGVYRERIAKAMAAGEQAKADEWNKKLQSLSKSGILALCKSQIALIQQTKAQLVETLSAKMQEQSDLEAQSLSNKTTIVSKAQSLEDMENGYAKALDDLKNAIAKLVDGVNGQPSDLKSLDDNFKQLKSAITAKIDPLQTQLDQATDDTSRQNLFSQIYALQDQIILKQNDYRSDLEKKAAEVYGKFAAATDLVQLGVTTLLANRKSVSDSYDGQIAKMVKDGFPQAEIDKTTGEKTAAIAAIDAKLKAANESSSDLNLRKQNVGNSISSRISNLGEEIRSFYQARLDAVNKMRTSLSADLAKRLDVEKNKLQAQSVAAQEEIMTRYRANLAIVEADFKRDQTIKQQTLDGIASQINDAIKKGRAAVAEKDALLASLANDKTAAADAQRVAINNQILKSNAEANNLYSQLQQASKNLNDQIQAKLDERRALDEAYIAELAQRDKWIRDSMTQELSLLQQLADSASGANKAEYDTMKADVSSKFKEMTDKFAADSKKAFEDLNAKIADQKASAEAAKAELQKTIEEQKKNYQEEAAKEQTRLEGQTAQNRALLQKQIDDLKKTQSATLAQLQKDLEESEAQALQAKKDAQEAIDLQQSLLSQQLKELTASINSGDIVDGDFIVPFFQDGDKYFYLEAVKFVGKFTQTSRFNQSHKFKLKKIEPGVFAIMTPDETMVLAVNGNNCSFVSNSVVAATGATPSAAKPINLTSDVHGFKFEVLDQVTGTYKITSQSANQDKLLTADAGGALLLSTNPTVKMRLARLTTRTQTLDSLLYSFLMQNTSEATRKAIDGANKYFTSAQVYKSQPLTKDFIAIVDEFVEERQAQKLFSEAAGDLLDVLIAKISKLSVAKDSASVSDLEAASNYLDPIALKAGQIIQIKFNNQFLGQVDGQNLGLVSTNMFDPSTAMVVVTNSSGATGLKLMRGNNPLSFDGSRLAFGSDAGADWSPQEKNIFGFDGTRKAASIKFGQSPIVIGGTEKARTISVSTSSSVQAAIFEVIIFDPASFEYELLSKSIQSFSSSNESVNAAKAIVDLAINKITNKDLSTDEQASLLNKFIQFLQNSVNQQSMLVWDQQIERFVKAVRSVINSNNMALLEKVEKAVASISVENGQIILFYRSTDQGENYVKRSQNSGYVCSIGLTPSAIFRVVALEPDLVGLVSDSGKFMAIERSGFNLVEGSSAVDPAGDGQTIVAKPGRDEQFRLFGSSQFVYLRPEFLDVDDLTTGYLSLGADDQLLWKNDKTGNLFDATNLRAKFSIHLWDKYSIGYVLATSSLPELGTKLYKAVAETVGNKNLNEAQIVNALQVMIAELKDSLLEKVALENGAKDLRVKPGFSSLVGMLDDSKTGNISIATAMGLIVKNLVYNPTFLPGGVKIAPEYKTMLDDIAGRFKGVAAAGPSTLVMLDTGDDEDPYSIIIKPSSSNLPMSQVLSGLLKDRADKMAVARVCHAFLTKVFSCVYGASFDDNSVKFNLNLAGEISFGDKKYKFEKTTTQTKIDSVDYTNCQMMSGSNAFDGQVARVIDEVYDDNGNLVSPERQVQEGLRLGLGLFTDSTGAPVILQLDKDLSVSSMLSLEQKNKVLDVLNEVKNATLSIIAVLPSSKSLLDKVIGELKSNIDDINYGSAPNTVSRAITYLLKNAAKKLMVGDSPVVRDFIKTFRDAKGNPLRKAYKTPAERQTALDSAWSADKQIPYDCLDKSQQAIFSMILAEVKKYEKTLKTTTAPKAAAVKA